MQIPESVQALIDAELHQLATSSSYSVHPHSRIEIYAALGPSNVMDDAILEEARQSKTLATLSAADYVRARIALSTARKVAGLWPQACLETNSNFSEHQDPSEIRQHDETYLAQRKQKHLEHISVYDVPRAYVPSHILAMAELARRGEIYDSGAFLQEANEWWGIYGRPEQMEREYFIKWAAQDALYEAIGWVKHNPEPPAEHALYAFAAVFSGEGFDNRKCTIDENKQHEFWRWWLSEAIPEGIANEGVV